VFIPVLGKRGFRSATALAVSVCLAATTRVHSARAQTPAGAAAPAPTSPPAPLAESLRGMARADYAAARILYEDGDYPGALTKLQAAYDASKDPRLLWNMAACEKALRHYVSVLRLLERYASEGAQLISEEERQATAQLVETVQAFVNELTLQVQPDGVDVLVDGVLLGTTPLSAPLRLDMGKRRLRLEKAGFVPHEQEVDLAGGKSATIELSLAPEVHEGTLRVVSDPRAVISVDGHVVGTATWSGTLPSGAHSVHVSAPGKQPHQTEVVIKDHDTSSLLVNLVEEAQRPLLAPRDPSLNTVWWVVGGIALAGAGLGTYFLLRPSDDPRQPELGSWGGFEL
jgi:PEGA domain